MHGIDGFEQQAFNLILGQAKEAFSTKGEDPKTIARYGKKVGQSLLSARRLCEAGASFVTVTSGGWDMHRNLESSIKSRGAEIDQGVSALIEDLHEEVIVKSRPTSLWDNGAVLGLLLLLLIVEWAVRKWCRML